MQNLFENYIKAVSDKFSHEETSEMGYRTDFEILVQGVFERIKVRRIDHDARAKEGNKPDFVVMNGDIPILYIEAKAVGVDLNKVEKSEQMTRYFGYANLVLTDYVEFRFYRNGIAYGEPIKIAEFNTKNKTVSPLVNNYEYLAKTLIDFAQSHREPIRSGNHLAKIMGGKAQRIRDNLKAFFTQNAEKNIEIMRVYEAIKSMLVHDLTLESFADMYAQTLVYGLFVARYYDESPETFSRQEARDLVPASNPFLQHFFDHIAGPNFDKRLSYIVDELCEVFKHANTKDLIEEYMGDADPVIHFYEDFLKEYDPELRKKMGAYYTPLPVVRFIVKAVDHILQRDFNLPKGLVDTSKLSNGKHKVQILDPAVGTGTFISATIRIIYEYLEKHGQKGQWPTYVHNELLPRLHGFELMMAPYTIAHLKLSLAFKKTGFWKFHRRLGIYLTNSLEQSSQQQDSMSFGFAESIADEAKEADKIKNETPIMVVVGNPPYSVSSSNKGKWISELIDVYKKDLDERNIQPLSDDYIKFLRFAEHFIEKNKMGIVAMITNNSFLDGRIHRQMRKHLLETFDDVYIIDLHGSSKKKEKGESGEKDENVFSIQQGVSISILVRRESLKEELGKVYHFDVYGSRKNKFSLLDKSTIETIVWKDLKCVAPYYFFVPKDFSGQKEYEEGFSINDLFVVNTSGIKTHHDDELVSFNQFQENGRDYLYRPFDTRFIEYDLKKVVRHRYSVMKNMLKDKDNVSLLTSKQLSTFDFQHVLVTKSLSDICSTSLQTKESTYVFPLYTYQNGEKIPNLKIELVDSIEKIVGKVTSEEVFDYIYAVLHSPSYREKYKEFLKIDFPRVPYPKDSNEFIRLVKLGSELRSLHLLESPKVNDFVTTYPIADSDIVEKISYKDGNVYINSEQYFGNVPEIAWNFYIGGYQPAQKWLKDRKGRTLTSEDIDHYQKIIVVLMETNRIMIEIG
ncbi:MAG: type ISP restriction/modification enzyme [Candidatus Gracilibacteria bacterium]|jgi:predicted helicase